ncbi:MAG: 50S ribosomal protein L25 [Chloroflexi bacterium]|nr:50S ribosomal protein L25 [Chloroflexota bacterium]
MEKIVLDATRRSVIGKQVSTLRRDGKLPAIMYGHNFEPTPITLDLHTTSIVLGGVSSSHLITINLEGKEYATLIREKQRDFIRGTLRHIDFQVVSLTEKIRTSVQVELTGESPAVRLYNGVVVNGITEVEIEALPQDLPDRLTLDLSSLKEIGDGLYVKDLSVSDKVTILTDMEEMIAVITAGAGEEAEAVSVETAEPEVIERGKKEEEEE